MELGETNDIKFHIGKKEYVINKLPIIFIVVIFCKCVFDNWLTLIVITMGMILGYIVDFDFRSKVELLIINKEEKKIKYFTEKEHSTGGGIEDPGLASSWNSEENYYVENIESVHESLFSFVIYGKVNFTKTQKNGTIKKINREKLVIKKIFETNEEIRECLNEIANTKSEGSVK